ncbi:MAG: glutamate 5-kinase [Lachnospiraceae bacterium]|nr:glutamate 5-kinase [Lachnospiraceae bacterium]
MESFNTGVSASRDYLKDKKRIVVKVGSSSITHAQTGRMNLEKIEKLVRVLSDLANLGKEVILVSSGAISVGSKALGMDRKPSEKAQKQACAAVGQANLMMVYQKLFAEYQHTVAQILLTKYTMIESESRHNAENTFNELMRMGVIPIVNENDTVATDEIEFGDNDTLSAIVAALVKADLLILLSDIEGLYTDDPHKNSNAQFIDTVEYISDEIIAMGKGATSAVGTGGMNTKISAARIANDSGTDMVIASSEDLSVVSRIISGEKIGTLFKAHLNENFHLIDYLSSNYNGSRK